MKIDKGQIERIPIMGRNDKKKAQALENGQK